MAAFRCAEPVRVQALINEFLCSHSQVLSDDVGQHLCEAAPRPSTDLQKLGAERRVCVAIFPKRIANLQDPSCLGSLRGRPKSSPRSLEKTD